MAKPFGLERWLRQIADGDKLRKKRGRNYPVEPDTPPRPWHPDGDWLFTTIPTHRLPDSDQIIAHMASVGPLKIRTGDPDPGGDGRVGGRPLNVCKPTDPIYQVVDGWKIGNFLRPGVVWINDGTHSAKGPIGARIRIPKRVRPEGWPMWDAFDSKVHLFDPNPPDGGAPTITEIQKFEPVLINTGIRCHSISHYSIDLPTVGDPRVKGSSSADYPVAESVGRHRDIVQLGARYRLTMGTPGASQDRVLWPAKASDNQAGGDHPHAVPMGAVLRLTPEAAARVRTDPRSGPQTFALVEVLEGPGIMVIDTSGRADAVKGHHAVSLEPHPDWDQDQLAPIRELEVTDFAVFALDPPPFAN